MKFEILDILYQDNHGVGRKISFVIMYGNLKIWFNLESRSPPCTIPKRNELLSNFVY